MGKYAITDFRAQDAADKQAVLEAAFAVVANPRDWKAPIDVTISDQPTLLEMVTDAIVHFTATVPKFTAIETGRVRVQAAGYRAGPAVAFDGWGVIERDGVSDACAYRKIMVSGSALAKAAIAKAEQLAGRTVDRKALAAGWHAHGDQWHKGH